MRHCFSNTRWFLICARPICSAPGTILHALVGSLCPSPSPSPSWNCSLPFCVPEVGTGESLTPQFLQQ